MKVITTKLVNMVTIALAVVFFLSATITTATVIKDHNSNLYNLEQLVNDANEFNFNHNLDLSIGAGDSGEEAAYEEYESAAEAFIDAYYNYINLESYYIVTNGKMDTIAVGGIEIKGISQNTMVKYKDGSSIYELISYTNQGREFKDHSATFIYYNKPEERIYMMKTEKVTKVSDTELVANYSGKKMIHNSVEFFRDTIGIMPGETIYEFTKYDWVPNKEKDQFTLVRNPRTGQVDYYIVSLSANAAKVSGPYENVIKFIADSSKSPDVLSMNQSANISPDGRLLSLSLSDVFTVTAKANGIETEATCYTDSKYNFIEMGGDISYPRPDTSDAEFGSPNDL